MHKSPYIFLLLVLTAPRLFAADPPLRTTLSDPTLKYRVAPKPYVVLRRGDVEAVVVNNQAARDDVLPGHRAGYSGVAKLTHKKQPRNIFVPFYAGLNFEHIHDGTTRPRDILFEPRKAPMELRIVDEHTVELYQPPTPTWGLESCQRYALLPSGALEMTIECIPRRKTFKNGYIGLFWASYIHQPESLDIHFRGAPAGRLAKNKPPQESWIRGVTPSHGVDATHVGAADDRVFPHDKDFPLTLVFNRSRYRYTQPWYYGVSHGMALAYIFRPQDQVRFSQSPSGGGSSNPAWDFQYLIPDYKIGQRYQMILRVVYVPYESRGQMEKVTQPHRRTLAQQSK